MAVPAGDGPEGWKGLPGRPMLCDMKHHDHQTTSTPSAVEDRQAIAAHYRTEAARQDTEDARAKWLGYRGETDFTDRAAAQLERHPALPSHLVRHARFVYFGTGR
jgi:hypothetical protein